MDRHGITEEQAHYYLKKYGQQDKIGPDRPAGAGQQNDGIEAETRWSHGDGRGWTAAVFMERGETHEGKSG